MFCRILYKNHVFIQVNSVRTRKKIVLMGVIFMFSFFFLILGYFYYQRKVNQTWDTYSILIKKTFFLSGINFVYAISCNYVWECINVIIYVFVFIDNIFFHSIIFDFGVDVDITLVYKIKFYLMHYFYFEYFPHKSKYQPYKFQFQQ